MPGPGKKILVADDSLTIQKVIRLALSHDGYEIHTVSSGHEALQKIPVVRPDVVLIDVSLPEKNAFEIKSEIDASSIEPKPQFILMSSAFEQVDEARVESLKFQGRLVKPFDPALLRQALGRVAGSIVDPSPPQPPVLDSEGGDESPFLPPPTSGMSTLGLISANMGVNSDAFPFPPPSFSFGSPDRKSGLTSKIKVPSTPPDPPAFSIDSPTLLEIKANEGARNNLPLPAYPGIETSEFSSIHEAGSLTGATLDGDEGDIPSVDFDQWKIDENSPKVQDPSKIFEISIDDLNFNEKAKRAKAMATPPPIQPATPLPQSDWPAYQELSSFDGPTATSAGIPAGGANPSSSAESMMPSRDDLERMIRAEIEVILRDHIERLLPEITERIVREEIRNLLETSPNSQ